METLKDLLPKAQKSTKNLQIHHELERESIRI